MSKKLFYTFALLSVAVLLGAAGCQQNNEVLNNSVNENEEAIMEGENMEGDGEMMEEGESMEADGAMMEEGSMKEGEEGMAEGGAMMEDENKEGAMMEKGEVREFMVEGENFKFSMEEIEVNKGDTVKITFKNTGGTHDWVIDEFNARTNIIQTGDTETIEFTADKEGTYEYYCSVGNHRAQGMKGNLIVK